jgi:HlyD family secretion protein
VNRRWLIAALLAAAGAGGWYALGRTPDAPAPVAAAPAQPMGVGALGRIEPASRIRKLNQPGGMAVTRLDRLHVAEGDEVRAGQLLAEFADAALKDAAAAQAEATLAEARATLARTRQAGRPSEVASQRARIASIAAQEEIARRDASRTDRLVVSGAGAEAVAERNRFLLTQLAAPARPGRGRPHDPRHRAPGGCRPGGKPRDRRRGRPGQARADAELARVRAPMDGTILRVFARPGDQVGSDGVLEMADLSRLDVVADVFETDLPRLRPGASAEIVIPGEAQRHAATVREIGWQVRRTTQAGTDPVAAVDSRTVEVRLSLSDEAAALLRRRSNMQVQVAIQPADSARVAAR